MTDMEIEMIKVFLDYNQKLLSELKEKHSDEILIKKCKDNIKYYQNQLKIANQL
jgi:hypothetical protein